MEKDLLDEECAYFAVLKSSVTESPHLDVIESLLEGVYEGDTICYLCATDAYAIVQMSISGCSVSLIHEKNVLLSFVVDSAWAVLAQSIGGFVWIIINSESGLGQTKELSAQQLIERSQQGAIELISISLCDGAPSAPE